MDTPLKLDDDVQLFFVLANNCLPARMTRAEAVAVVRSYVNGQRFDIYHTATMAVRGDLVIGMFIQELPYDHRGMAKMQEEMTRRQLERERREDRYGGSDDGD